MNQVVVVDKTIYLIASPFFSSTTIIETPVTGYSVKGAQFELKNLLKKGTWIKIDKSEATSPLLPLKWVFTHKEDIENYLERARARICVRGDLQPNNELQTTTSRHNLIARDARQ